MKNNKNFDSELIARMSKMFNNEKKESCCCNDNKCDCGTEIPITFVGVDKEDKCKCEEQKCCDMDCIYEAPKVLFDKSEPNIHEKIEVDIDEDCLKSMVSGIVNELFGDELAKGNIKKIGNENDLEFFKEEIAKSKIKEVDDEIDLDLEEDEEFDDIDNLFLLKEHMYFELNCSQNIDKNYFKIDVKDLCCFTFSDDKAQFSVNINASKETLELYSLIVKNKLYNSNKVFTLVQFIGIDGVDRISVPIKTFALDEYEVNVDGNSMKIKLKSI